MSETVRKRLAKSSRLWQLLPDDIASLPSSPSTPSSSSSSSGGMWQRSGRSIVTHPTGVASLGMYTFVVADSERHGVLVVDIARNIVSTIGQGQVWPNDVTVNRDMTKILVTDRKEKVIKTYDIRGDLVSVWALASPRGSVTDEVIPAQPHGLAMTSRGETVVTDTGSHSVAVLSEEGRTLRRFGRKGDLLQQLRLPFFCAVDGRDQVLVSDNMNYCVKIFDSRGNYLNRIGSASASGSRQFQCPYGLAVDPWSDEILVSDNDTHRVYTFSGGPTGGKAGPQDNNNTPYKFLRYALTGPADGLQNPTGLALGPCGLLAVTECGPDRANVKAFRIYESLDGRDNNIEQTWTSRIESAV